jgi:hypothetical protein
MSSGSVHVGALIEGTARLVTIPHVVADPIRAVRPSVRRHVRRQESAS